jgi:hypothetical protein
MERFRKTWRGEVISSEGFSVRIVARTALLYKDREGSTRIDCEAMTGGRLTVQMFSESIPDTPSRPRQVVVDNVRRAFLFAGWTLLPS